MSKKLKNNGHKNIVMDTAPLLLLLIGLYDTNQIGKFKRVSKFNETDFELLSRFVSRSRITVTPEVLAEVSNFAQELKGERFAGFITANMETLKKLGEVYIKKEDILGKNEVFKLGFTDTSLLLLAQKDNANVLTDDTHLWSRCKNLGIKTTLLNEILSMKDLF